MWNNWIADISLVVGCCVLPLAFVGFAIFLHQFSVKEKKTIRKSHEISDSFIMPITEEADKIRRELKRAEKAYEEADEYPPLALFFQIAAGSDAWKNQLERVVKTKKEQKKKTPLLGIIYSADEFVLALGRPDLLDDTSSWKVCSIFGWIICCL